MAALVLAAVVLRAFLWPISPNDFWWHLAVGRWIFETGAIPRMDVFSWTRAGEPFWDQPWLAQVAMYSLHRLGGVEVVATALAACLALAFGLLLLLCSLRTGRPWLAAVVVLATLPASAAGWTLRTQVVALPLFVTFLLLLTDWRLGLRDRKPALWSLPLLEILWVNVHGSFVLGPILVALVLAGEGMERFRRNGKEGARGDPPPGPRLRGLAGWGAAVLAATFVNPFGPSAWGSTAGLVLDPTVQGTIVEWLPPSPATVAGLLYFLYLAALLATGLISRRRPDWADTLVTAAFLVLSLTGRRHALWFVLATTPLLAVQIVALPRLRARRVPAASPATRAADRGRLAPASALALLALSVVLASPWIKPRLPLPEAVRPLLAADTPVRSVRVLRDHTDPPERLFHSEAFGSYLMWAAPERKVFIDVRVQLYPPEQILDYRRLSAGIDVARLLDKYEIDGLLIDYGTQEGLAAWALTSPDWDVVFRDAVSAYMVRRVRE